MYAFPTSTSASSSKATSTPALPLSSSSSISTPLTHSYAPLSHSHGSLYGDHAPPTFAYSSSSAAAALSRYESHAAPLSSSSLEAPVYRGVFHAHEPTSFAATSHQAQLWQSQAQHQHADAFSGAAVKKLELAQMHFPTASPAYATPVHAAAELELVPSHVERFTSFYSTAGPAVISKALRIGFQTVSEMRVEFAEEANKGKFRGEVFTEDHESVPFMVRVYKTGSAAPAPYLIEFQRRCGDSVSFFRFFQKMVKSCAAIHHGPFEAAFTVAGMSVPPVLPLPSPTMTNTLAMPSMAALRLDFPSVSSLCSMVSSDCIESKRESAKALANVSAQSPLFPPTLERQASEASAFAASKAIWNAVVHILRSNDRECARLGASILRHCLARGDTDMLLAHLDADRSVVSHLVERLAHEPVTDTESSPDAFSTREIRRQVAAVLHALVAKKGQAYVTSIAPDAVQVINYYTRQQQQGQ